MNENIKEIQCLRRTRKRARVSRREEKLRFMLRNWILQKMTKADKETILALTVYIAVDFAMQ